VLRVSLKYAVTRMDLLDSVDTRLTKVKNCIKKQGNHGTTSRNTSIQTARFE